MPRPKPQGDEVSAGRRGRDGEHFTFLGSGLQLRGRFLAWVPSSSMKPSGNTGVLGAGAGATTGATTTGATTGSSPPKRGERGETSRFRDAQARRRDMTRNRNAYRVCNTNLGKLLNQRKMFRLQMRP